MLRHAHPDMKPERVVVIGGHGFVGGAVCRKLKVAEIEHLGLGRREVDLQAENAAEQLGGYLRTGDAVVLAAARAPCKNTAMLVENMLLLKTIIRALGRVPLSHVINVSSDAVYGDKPLPLKESSPAAPQTLHGVMHLAREIALGQELNAPLANVRTTLLYGAADPHNGYGPNRFCRLAAQGKTITLFGEGEERRDHVFIDDVAELILRMLLRGSTGVFNVATGDVHSFHAIAEMVVGAATPMVGVTSAPRSGPMPHNGYRPFDTTVCRAAFPDFSYVNLPDGIRRMQREVENGSV